MSKFDNFKLGSSLVIGSSFFYASYGIWTKLIGDAFSGYSASALRSVIVVLLLLPIALITKKVEPLNLRHNYKATLGLIVFSCMIWGPLYYAVLKAGVGIALTVSYVSIVIGSFIFGYIFNKESLTKIKVASLILGILGLSLIYSPQAGDAKALAIIAAIVAGLATAANTIIIKKVDYGPTQSTLLMWYTSIVANLFMATVLKESLHVGSAINYLYLTLFAISSILATLMLVKAVKIMDVSIAGILGLTEIVFGVLFGLMFFNEHLNLSQILGIIIIIGACALPYAKAFKLKFLKGL
jgi:drug/metabolite transporter (DMT)-like permease